MKARAAATQIITAILRNKGSLNTLLPRYARQVDPQEQGLFKELCFGCIRWQPRLACIIDSLLKKPLKSKDTDLQAILLLGLYQLAYTRVPPHAAINEAVAAAKTIKKTWAKGLINGTLRNFQRSQQQLESQLENDPVFNSAHPLWLVNTLQEAWPENWQDVISANNQHPPMTLRVNSRLFRREDYCDSLEQQGLDATQTVFSPDGIQLLKPVAVDELPDFEAGAVSVQDEAAQLASVLLKPGPGDRILDACCAPGGKLIHLAEKMTADSVLHGVELEQTRLQRVEENLQRLKQGSPVLPSIRIFQGDAQQPSNWWDGEAYNKILLDAPCSATGVIRRNPDIKLLRTPEQITQLSQLQFTIASTLWPLLETGGTMLYATCSSLPIENDQVISRLVDQLPDMDVIPIDANWGRATVFGRQLFPTQNGHDGFYYALLGKKPV